LIQAKTQAAAVIRKRNPAVKRIWNSLFMDPWGDTTASGHNDPLLPREDVSNFAAMLKSFHKLVNCYSHTTSIIIGG
jgi:hypothetical protein